MSSKLDIYNAIKDKLDGLKTSNDPLINTVGLWNNQFDNEDLEKPFNYPVCFIEFANIRWDGTHQTQPRGGVGGGNVQKEQRGSTTEKSLITIHLGFSEFGDGKDILEPIDPVIDAVYFALQGLQGDTFTTLSRIEERQDVNHGRIIDWQIDFNTSLSQEGEEDTSLRRIAADTLGLTLTKDLDINTGTETGVRTGDGDVTT